MKKSIRNLFFKPERALESIRADVGEMVQGVRESLEKHPLDGIVLFFDSVSKMDDRIEKVREVIRRFEEVNRGQYDQTITDLRTLKAHISNAGRNRYGHNRTEPGETVTPQKVFLGDTYGLFTHPVSYWKKQKDGMRGLWKHPKMKDLNAYDVVTIQAEKFMKSHAPMIDIAEKLEHS